MLLYGSYMNNVRLKWRCLFFCIFYLILTPQYVGYKKKFITACSFLSLQCYTTIQFISEDKTFELIQESTIEPMIIEFNIQNCGYSNCQHTQGCVGAMNLNLVTLFQVATTPIKTHIFKKKKLAFIIQRSTFVGNGLMVGFVSTLNHAQRSKQ